MPFPILSCILVFIVWLTYELKKQSRISEAKRDEFWNREAEANSVRRQSLDSIDYITIPIKYLPFLEVNHEKLLKIQNEILKLAEKQIVNLTGYSNTDLKLQYGVANLPQLTEWDQNFTLLARLIVQWGELLHELGYDQEAIQVLEFGIECKTDVSKNYKLLAQLYVDAKTPDKIEHLANVASQLNSLMKPSILRTIESYRNLE